MNHFLKVNEKDFEALKSGKKTFEIRANDGDFRVNDIVVFQEWLPEERIYSGDRVVRVITHISNGLAGLTPGYIIMGLAPIPSFTAPCSPPYPPGNSDHSIKGCSRCNTVKPYWTFCSICNGGE